MVDYTVQEFGDVKIVNNATGGKEVAKFDITTHAGSLAYSMFWRGLADHGDHTLFDVDQSRFLVGGK